MNPTATIGAIRGATATLLRELEASGWSDADVREPSLLPGWTRGHVLGHISLNADGITATLLGALRGKRVERYPGGTAARNAAIEAAAGSPLAELIEAIRRSAQRLDTTLTAVAEEQVWETITDEGRTAGEWPARRWREVEIHNVDLAGRYSATDWPAAFIEYLLPELASGLAHRGTVPLRVEVTAERSTSPALVGQVWTCGQGDPVGVSGPDWALLAWMTGRPTAAEGALSAPPQITAWI